MTLLAPFDERITGFTHTPSDRRGEALNDDLEQTAAMLDDIHRLIVDYQRALHAYLIADRGQRHGPLAELRASDLPARIRRLHRMLSGIKECS